MISDSSWLMSAENAKVSDSASFGEVVAVAAVAASAADSVVWVAMLEELTVRKG